MKKSKWLVSLLVISSLLLTGCKSSDYKKAQEYFDSGEYKAAKDIYLELGDYKDSEDMSLECDYQLALKKIDEGNYTEAIELFTEIIDYSDSKDQIDLCKKGIFIDTLGDGINSTNKKDGISYTASIFVVDDYVVGARADIYYNEQGILLDSDSYLEVNLLTGEATLTETYTIGSAVKSGTDKGTISFNIYDYSKDGSYEWDDTDIEVNVIEENPNIALSNCISLFQDVINGCDENITMSDIGFKAY